MEEEEEAVVLCDLVSGRVNLGFFEGNSVEDLVFFFQPLLEELVK